MTYIKSPQPFHLPSPYGRKAAHLGDNDRLNESVDDRTRLQGKGAELQALLRRRRVSLKDDRECAGEVLIPGHPALIIKKKKCVYEHQQGFAKGLSAHLGCHSVSQLSQLHGDTSPLIDTPSVNVVIRIGECHTGYDVVLSVGLGLRYIEELDADMAQEGARSSLTGARKEQVHDQARYSNHQGFRSLGRPRYQQRKRKLET